MIKDLGDSIRRTRLEHGMTATEVARRAHMGYNTYRRYESGERTPDIYMLEALADVFGISLDKLTGRYEDEELRNINQWTRVYGISSQRFGYWVRKLGLGKSVPSDKPSGKEVLLSKEEVNEVISHIRKRSRRVEEEWLI